MSALDVEIARVADAVRRAAADLATMHETARGSCCAACLFGQRFSRPAAAQERRRAWLAVLFRKRGHQGDEDLARSVVDGTWP